MTAEVSKDKLVADLKLVVADAEELLRATAGQAGEKVAAARDKVQASLSTAKLKMVDAERALIGKTKESAKLADEYVRDNPWQAVGVAAAVGLVLGLLIGRR